MNKSDLIYKVSDETELPKDDVAYVVDTVFKTIRKSLVKGESVQILGFGTFKLSHKKEREVINPRTHEPMIIPAHKSPVFIPGKSLKEAIR